MHNGVETLQPQFREKVLELLAICEKNNLPARVFECVRTRARQDELYAQGRTLPGKVVTEAQGRDYKSFHQWGLAVDIIRNDGYNGWDNSDNFFDKLGALGESIGLVWGGRFKRFDGPHFQSADFSVKGLIDKWGTPDKFIASWKNN